MKRVWVGSIALIVVLLAVGGWYAMRSPGQASISPEVVVNTTPTLTPEDMREWKDQAGFSFSYPSGVTINPHEEDQENYAHLELTHPAFAGSIFVWAKDLPAQAGTTVDSWVKKEKSFDGAAVLDTTFADRSASKILLSTPTKKIVTAAVDDGIVFYVEGNFTDSEYWTKAYETITNSFAFVPLDGESPGVSELEVVSVDEEEVLE